MHEIKTVGIILAAGKSTRLYPASYSIPKPLLPIYDKPAIFYSISMMIRMGINNIAVICPQESYDEFLDTLARFDISNLFITVIPAKNKDRGILQDLYNAKAFCHDADKIILTFPDNIFIGEELDNILIEEFPKPSQMFKSVITHSWIPEKFGVLSGPDGNIIEKPKGIKANLDARIVTGLYYYPNNRIFEVIENILMYADEGTIFSITDLNNAYIDVHSAYYIDICRKQVLWYDIGTADNMLEASKHIHRYYKDTDELLGCIEAEAYKKGFITAEDVIYLMSLIQSAEQSAYIQYIMRSL